MPLPCNGHKVAVNKNVPLGQIVAELAKFNIEEDLVLAEETFEKWGNALHAIGTVTHVPASGDVEAHYIISPGHG